MIVWGCLRSFLVISTFFDSCAPVHALDTLPNNWDLVKSSKIIKNHRKYSKKLFFASKCPQQLPKNDQKTHLQCLKPFSEGSILFNWVENTSLDTKLENHEISIFGHTNLAWSIWNLGPQNRAREIENRKIEKKSKNCSKIHNFRPISVL